MAQSKPLENYGNLPLSFEANQGQTDARVKFLSRGIGYSLFLTQDDAVFSLHGRTAEGSGKASPTGRSSPPVGLPTTSVVLHMKLVNANLSAKVIGEEELTGRSNYFIGNDPKKWSTNVGNYAKVKYERVYSGIDLVYYGNQRQLEYDFVVAPGADPRRIEFNIAGAKYISRDQSGDLVLQMAEGQVRWHKPVVYQEQGGIRHEVEGRYAIKPGHRVGFEVANYDAERPLIIDPVLTFSTYTDDHVSGGPAAIAIDAEGNTYLTGLTFSAAYPTTPGVFQMSCKSCKNNSPDVFVTKLNPTGTAQVYSTFLGGSDYDQPFGIAVDKDGNAVVAGRTESTDFPVKNNIPVGYSGTGTEYGFVTSFAADGSSLNYSSILGGGAQPFQSSTTLVNAIALDPSGNSYIAGETDSPVFPVTSGAINSGTPSYPVFTVFATKFLPNGSLAYSALLGVGGGVSAIRVDTLGSAYLAGQAGSLWPTTAGAYQSQTGGPTPAPFVTKLSPDASSLAYSTFVGNGSVTGLTINTSGDAWITGAPNSPGFPTTSNAYNPNEPPSNCCDPFFAELDETGSHLLYSSFFYGSSDLFFSSGTSSIALDQLGNIWLAGGTNDPQLPLLHPIQSLLGGPGNPVPRSGFVSRFDPTGTKLTFSTFFGDPSGQAQISAIALDSANKAHVAGFAGPQLFTTSGAFLASVTPPPHNIQGVYGFAATIDADVVAPSLCIAYPQSQGLYFGGTQVGSSRSQVVTVTNCGTASLTISGIQASNSVFRVPDATNGCKGPQAVGQSCSVSLVFKPTSAAPFEESVTFRSNASVPLAVLPVSGLGTAFVVTITGSPQQPLTKDSNGNFVAIVTIANNGNVTAVPVQVTIAGTTLGSAALLSAPASLYLAAGQSATVALTFPDTPALSAAKSALLKVSGTYSAPSISVPLNGKWTLTFRSVSLE